MRPHPFALRQRHIYVPVSIGDPPVTGEFLLDTGASMTCVSTSFLGRVRLPIAGVRGATAHAAGGLIGHSVEGVMLPSLTVAGETRTGVQITQVNANPLRQQFGHAPDGVLGVNFLQHFEVALHFPARTLTLTPSDDARDPAEWSRLEAAHDGILNAHLRDGWLFELEATLADRVRVTTLLDLGAPRSILNWNAARALGYTPESPELRPGRTPLLGMDGRTITPLYAPPMPMDLGPVRWPACVFAIADMPIAKQLHIGFMPLLILGTDLLEQFELVLNYLTGRLGLFLPGTDET